MRQKKLHAAGALTLVSLALLSKPVISQEQVQEIRVSGISEPGEILIDQWGVAHIYGESTSDAFFLQGFNAARDRLWQIDFWRRRGLGLLSEVFGPEFVEHDRAARLFLYRGRMSEEWLTYGDDARDIYVAFVDGINAYVRLTQNNPGLLPIEFQEAGYEPAFWSADDVIRIRAHGLIGNAPGSELTRARTLCDLGEEAEYLRTKLQPTWQLEIPSGIDVCQIPEGIERIYQLARQPVPIDPGHLPISNAQAESEGSNNWAIAPGRSATGRPVVANDPHRAFGLPSLRYVVHVESPSLRFIGAGEPFVPGVSIGHNGHVAFGLTIFRTDQQDIYIYETNSQNPQFYRYGNDWEEFEFVTETIPVRGAAPEEVQLQFTRHGPVIFSDARNEKVYALRSMHLEPGTAAYIGSLNFLSAGTTSEFTRALDAFGSPNENYVFADVDGNIEWKATSFVPIRTNWDGLLPVPGDGTYEWLGTLQPELLPGARNPESGWLATANNLMLPQDYPYAERRVGFEWTRPARIDRIREVLGAPDVLPFETSLLLQNDLLSVPAREAVQKLIRIEAGDPQAVIGINLLREWDYRLTPDSTAAALYSIWERNYLPAAIYSAFVGEDKPEDFGVSGEIVRDFVSDANSASGGKLQEADMDRLLESSLAEAVADLTERAGGDLESITWGDIQKLSIRHPLSDTLSSIELNCSNAIGLSQGGGPTTVDVSNSSDEFLSNSGASFRMVIDVGEWDNSRAVNMPGQSGNQANIHYCDLMELWEAGDYFPLLFSRTAVEESADKLIHILPD